MQNIPSRSQPLNHSQPPARPKKAGILAQMQTSPHSGSTPSAMTSLQAFMNDLDTASLVCHV
ncbi:MAG TPA: hypothetical protein PKC22_08440, partial [Rhodocyclaceae bacterium]|nr:hypothetical protein [Rhodocyclaceae bacterium]